MAGVAARRQPADAQLKLIAVRADQADGTFQLGAAAGREGLPQRDRELLGVRFRVKAIRSTGIATGSRGPVRPVRRRFRAAGSA